MLFTVLGIVLNTANTYYKQNNHLIHYKYSKTLCSLQLTAPKVFYKNSYLCKLVASATV